MKFIPIPPAPHHVEFMAEQDAQFVLAHLRDVPGYTAAVKKVRNKVGSPAFTLLDNGAYELGESMPMADILSYAREIQAHELVLPDVLYDGPATARLTAAAMKNLLFANWIPDRVMIVPQGKTITEWVECLTEQMRAYAQFGSRVTRLTIGVPRHTSSFPGGRYKLLMQYLNGIVQRDSNVLVHLLGWEEDLAAPNKMVQTMPWIRSIDSAKPFRYALDHLVFDLAGCPEYTNPRDKYFNTVMEYTQNLISSINIERFEAAVKVGSDAGINSAQG